jgi:hypothetical protein
LVCRRAASLLAYKACQLAAAILITFAESGDYLAYCVRGHEKVPSGGQ